MKIGVPSETVPGERRVALVPDVVRRPHHPGVHDGFSCSAGAGAGAFIPR